MKQNSPFKKYILMKFVTKYFADRCNTVVLKWLLGEGWFMIEARGLERTGSIHCTCALYATVYNLNSFQLTSHTEKFHILPCT